MTGRLYDADAYLHDFEARVLSCEETDGGFAVLLDRTAFFPEGGGQASDRGTLGGAYVGDVQLTGGRILHYTDRPLPVGEAVSGRIDWERRFDFMQNHSGEHIVSGVAHRLYGCENVGFHLGDAEMTLDLDIPLSDAQLDEVERQANAAVFMNVRITARYPAPAELQGLSYRSKGGIDGPVRIVEIDGVDRCACCAPHVAATGEVGLIKLLDRERLRGGLRIYLKCGQRALLDYGERYRNIRLISDLLSAKQEEAAAAVEQLNDRLCETRQQTEALRRRLIAALIDAADEAGPVLFAEGLDMRELQQLADGLQKRLGGLRAAVSDGRFAACGEEAALMEWLADLREHFPVRGGGRGGMVQGTVSADEAALKAYFERPIGSD